MKASSCIPVHWRVAESPDEKLLEGILSAPELSDLHPAVARVVARRVATVEDAKVFLNVLTPPFCESAHFPDLSKAVVRLRQAIRDHTPILVFGDYDTDGITATVLMEQALRMCGALVSHFIPDRRTEGYGLTESALSRALRKYPKTRLLVTVDCGITSVAEVETLNQNGIDVIITDHHKALERLPSAFAIINPRLAMPKGIDNLCGCATAFIVVRELASYFLDLKYKEFLDLVAVATIADVMSLTGESRKLVTEGLRVLGDPRYGNPGLSELLRKQGIKEERLTAEEVAYKVTPCINAASRVGHWETAYKLLTRTNGKEAPFETEDAWMSTIDVLLAANDERKKCEAALQQRLQMTLKKTSDKVIIAAGTLEEGFHPGVLGIVAARLVDQFHLPSVVCCVKEDGTVSGSIRSLDPCDAVKALEAVSDLCLNFGGHPAAAGFTLKVGKLDAFKERFPKAFESSPKMSDILEYDDELMCPLNEAFFTALEKLEPYGMGNPRPRFVKQFVLLSEKKFGKDKVHVEYFLQDPSDPSATELRAVWFGAAHRVETRKKGDVLRVMFTVSRDRMNSEKFLLRVVDAIRSP